MIRRKRKFTKFKTSPASHFMIERFQKRGIWTEIPGADPGARTPPPPTTKTEAPAPKFYKIEAPEWQF